MLAKLLGKFTILGVLTALVSCNSQPTPTSTPEPPASPPSATGVIVISDVNKNAAKKIKQFQPMADYLATNLSQFEIGVGEVKVARDLETIANWLKSGEVDLYFDSPYPAMRVVEMSGAQPILRRWKHNTAQYFGVIFVMADSGIASVDDLKGKMIAFEEPVSTSGYFLPLNYLLEAGLNTVKKNSPRESVAADKVGYVFSNDDENTIQWVISGEVDAGAADLPTFMAIPEESRKAMKLLAETEKLPRHIVIVRPGMDPEQVAAIKAVLIQMDKTPEGKKALEAFEQTAKFDDFPTETSLARMRELYERVKKR
ncbi:MAG: phosphate/phosphite/phosphonate ABC transporter substrate-binding protein [Xenococcaceae cyanobacterium]